MRKLSEFKLLTQIPLNELLEYDALIVEDRGNRKDVLGEYAMSLGGGIELSGSKNGKYTHVRLIVPHLRCRPITLTEIMGDGPFSFIKIPWNEQVEADQEFLWSYEVSDHHVLNHLSKHLSDFAKVHGGMFSSSIIESGTPNERMLFRLTGDKPVPVEEEKSAQETKAVEICMLDIIEKDLPEGERTPENILKLICKALYPNYKPE